MKMINIYEAKTHLSQLLEQVQRGEEVVIAKNGQPIADIKPHQPKPNPLVAQAFGSMNGQFSYQDKDLEGVDPDIQKLFYGKDWQK